ncbi:MAG: TIGR01458 family HAD-type hydrolase, partial [Aliifodinibius sp.]|nr:TIGR01458 family HAD-type hydrolase [Fodinibius sp.]NIW46558.1 TIGR01458 family HAD-type hydrolase [Gammaproteobacteria bacterium]NIY27452.1 TIGR01458 family HAD-type hydrolase [Fodinibius sp.]
LTPFLLIHDKLKEEFCDLESTDFDCVLVGDAEKAFSYDHLNEAFRTLMNGATLIAMGNNRYFRDGEKLSLDAGPFVKALEYASGKEAIVIGKPSRDFFMSAISGMSCNPDEIMMIGD